jgi:carbamoyltransferase
MNIIGVGGFTHDSSATLLCDGKIVAAAEEERFTRKKHQEGWPTQAIAFCLRQARLTERDIDHIAFYWRPWTKDSLRSIGRRLRYLPTHPTFSAGFLIQQLHDTAWYMFHLRRFRESSGGRAQIQFVRHHDTHAGSAFFCSPFEEAAVLTIDSRGEWATSVGYHGRGNHLQRINRIDLPHSVGVLYLSTTNFLGFKTGDEYKVMGLAAYGKPRYLDKFRRLVELRPDGTYRLDTSYFTVQHSPGRYVGYVTKKFTDLFGPPRKPDSELTAEHQDIAASLQEMLEEVLFHMLRHLHQSTGSKKLCLAGGVAQNSVMCGKITRETSFNEVFIQPASGDNGCSLGAAEWVHNEVLNLPRSAPFPGCDLGPEYSEKEILALLEVAKLRYRCSADVAHDTAKLIAEGRIIGWFQGRMEWGARALGHRSILADVTNPEMTNIVNRYVKHREDFRPFAPACIAEAAEQFFDTGGPTPYMLKVIPARARAKQLMPAIVHVDDSARLQTVTRESNPLFYRLLEEMQHLKGVPCVLNTSFNIKGEPIVCSPMDAVKCWASTGIDVLVLGPFILEKEAPDAR